MSWADAIKFIIPAIVPVAIVVIGWVLNSHSERQWQQYNRVEERYIGLLKSLEGFYESTNQVAAKEQKEEFLKELRLCWLYCSDEAITKANIFLDHVSTGAAKTEKEQQEALQAFVFQLRQDLYSEKPRFWPWTSRQTKLSPEDFRILSST